MRHAALSALPLLALTALSPGAGWAQAQQEVTEAQAQAVEKQIDDWLATTSGIKLTPGEHPIAVAAQSDHYRFTLQLGDPAQIPPITATGVAQPNGQWSIQDIRLPSPGTAQLDMPAKAPDGSLGRQKVSYAWTIAEQSAQMLFDPTFTAANMWTSTVKGFDVHAEGDMLEQRTRMDASSTAFVSQPSSPGRVNVSIDNSVQGYRVTSSLPNSATLVSTFAKVHGVASATDVSRSGLVDTVRALVKLGQLMPKDGKMPSPEDAEATHALTSSLWGLLADLASGVTLDQTAENVTLSIGGMEGSARNAVLGFGAKSEGGRLQARLDLGVDGLTLPELGLGSMAALLPTKVALRPVVAGIPTDALLKALQSTKDGGSPSGEEIEALFAKGEITAGLESLILNLAGAEVMGQGKVAIVSPTDVSGSGQVTATGFDLLQQRVAAEPQLAMAAPALIFLKGIGRTVDNKMVWDVTYRGGHLVVNSQDLTAMTGSSAPDGTPSPASPGQRSAPLRRQ